MTNPEQIRFEVALHFGVSVQDLQSPKRHRRLAWPRQVAMYLCRALTSLSYPEIGAFFGGRDHTTAMYAVRLVEERWEESGEVAAHVDFLASRLEVA